MLCSLNVPWLIPVLYYQLTLVHLEPSNVNWDDQGNTGCGFVINNAPR